MSNKPLKIREKNEALQAPAKPKPAPSPNRWAKARKWLSQLGLGLCLLALCCLYCVNLNDGATAVVARKRELPIYSVQHDDKVIAISFAPQSASFSAASAAVGSIPSSSVTASSSANNFFFIALSPLS